MKPEDRAGSSRDSYHHGNLREALIQAALAMIAERGLAGFAISEIARAVGVSPAAPYRHFRDRNALLAEVARRGFDTLANEMEAARLSAPSDPVAGLERCAKSYLAFARREPATFAAMFEGGAAGDDPALRLAHDQAVAALRRAADAACATAPGRPPAMMVALHVWSMVHGIAALFVMHQGGIARRLPMAPDDLLEAGLLVYVQALGLQRRP